MTTYAVLVGVSKSDQSTAVLPEAGPAVVAVQSALAALGASSGNMRLFVDGAAQLAKIRGAFTDLAPHVTAADTFVFMFAGHGVMAAGADTDGMALTGPDVFYDTDLADLLGKLPAGTQRIVAVDCCFALAIAKPGPGPGAPNGHLPHHTVLAALGERAFSDSYPQELADAATKLKISISTLLSPIKDQIGAAQDRFADQLKEGVSNGVGTPPASSPLVFLSAASANGGIIGSVMRLFSTLIAGNAVGRRSYDELSDDFALVHDDGSISFVLQTPSGFDPTKHAVLAEADVVPNRADGSYVPVVVPHVFAPIHNTPDPIPTHDPELLL